ncbi:MAG: hypothetical protein H7A51_13165 [Akkermansiaceae bacterium]|nr:hypothetical protein [Akkermansiaceae bacterium]
MCFVSTDNVELPVCAWRADPVCRSSGPRGFALVATISVMVLLVLVALAMLGLGTVEMRASRQSNAMQQAQANARMALMIAIGELQKQAGPDQRVTATGWITDADAVHRHMAGVWDSWRPDPFNPPADYDAEKNGRFRRWLVSNADDAAVSTPSFAVDGTITNPVGMLGAGTLGAEGATEDHVNAGKVPVAGAHAGNMAWVVMDEGVKARVDLPLVKSPADASLAERSAVLGSAGRAALEKINPDYNPDPATARPGKMITVGEIDLDPNISGAASPVDMGRFSHDLTVWSQGVMSNVVDGGLREDLSLMTGGATLPTEFAGQRIYTGPNPAATPPGPMQASCPYWQQIFDYASLYKRVRRVPGAASGDFLPEIDVSAPAGYDAVPGYHVQGKIYNLATGQIDKTVWVPHLEARYNRSNFHGPTPGAAPVEVAKESAEGAVLMPVIAKIQMIYSLVTRDAHNEWGRKHPEDKLRRQTGDPNRDYMLHIVYSPVVTLYNPYNVAMKFDRLRVDFQNVPVAFRFYRNGQPQSNGYHPIVGNTSSHTKSFLMSLDGRSSRDTPKPVTLLPGEVRVFSSFFEPNYSWQSELAQGRGGNGTYYFDVNGDYNKITLDIKAVPGWAGEGIGFETDYLFPVSDSTPARVAEYSHDPSWSNSHGVIGLRWDDEVKVEYKPAALKNAEDRFMVVVSTADPATGEPSRIGAVEMDFDSEAKLTAMLPAPAGKAYIYPQPGEPPLTCSAMYESNNELLANYAAARAFCVFSAYGKTSFGGTAGGGEGRYATKAWCFGNPLSDINSAALKDEHGSHHFYELNLEPMPGNTINQVQVNAENQGRFITGHTANAGLNFGVHSELPVAPVQSVAGLQNANLNASGYLPKFDYPVANSQAHPLLPAGAAHSGEMLDHSYLLNHHLFDRFYCSTVSEYAGGMFDPANARTTAEVLEGFLNGDKPLLDTRFSAWTGGKSTTDISADVHAADGYKKIAAYQMLRGEWNVNSVSKEAWKAVLGGLHHSDFPVYDALTNSLVAKSAATNPVSRFRLPNSLGEADDDPLLARHRHWNGYRELDEDELDELATEIVSEVRKRGPFLSLAEFVNRRLSGPDELTLSGALQAAIDRTDINAALSGDGVRIGAGGIDVSGYEYANVKAAEGHSTQAAPGGVSQGHLMNLLGNTATVRSNTFTVRAYGESVDAVGKVLARAWCEAVVQRVPDYLDSADANETGTAALTSPANKIHGRRLRMVSFRWLTRGGV